MYRPEGFSARFPIDEEQRLLFQEAAYVADPATKRIIDVRDSRVDPADLHLIRQGLMKLRGDMPMNSPRLPQPEEPAHVYSLMAEVKELAQEVTLDLPVR